MAILRIKEIAMSQGFTQETLAFRSGVKMRTVQRLWQDKVPHPRTEVMIKIAGVLNVPVQELYTEEGLKSALENIAMPMSAAALHAG
jgi:transcriptional regulator with XRE-family HTH domain